MRARDDDDYSEGRRSGAVSNNNITNNHTASSATASSSSSSTAAAVAGELVQQPPNRVNVNQSPALSRNGYVANFKQALLNRSRNSPINSEPNFNPSSSPQDVDTNSNSTLNNVQNNLHKSENSSLDSTAKKPIEESNISLASSSQPPSAGVPSSSTTYPGVDRFEAAFYRQEPHHNRHILPKSFIPHCTSTPLPVPETCMPLALLDHHHHRAQHHPHHHPHHLPHHRHSPHSSLSEHTIPLHSVPTTAVPPYEMAAQSYMHCAGPSRSTSLSFGPSPAGSSQQHATNNASKTLTYVYELPYNVRKAICDLLDADQTWRELGGRYMAFNDTQLTLFSHALYRSASPTNELLIKWESSNAKIAHLFRFLADMKHRRAMFHLLPFVDEKLRLHYETFDNEVFDPQIHELPKASAPMEMMMMSQEKEFLNNNRSDFVSSVSTTVEKPFHYSSPQKTHKSQNLSIAKPIPEVTNVSNASEEKTLKDRAKQDYMIKIEDFEIPYKELAIAADDFAKDNILGAGGFGTVYIGEWKGTKVAIKKLNGLNNISQAVTELRVLNCCRIDNILPLYGVSLDGPEPCLVYQYMPNGSLENRLLCKGNTTPLTWLQRSKIAEGVARALNFLHTLKGNPYVHGDVKSANILLDAQFEPRLGDFGLARKVEKSGGGDNIYTHCTVSQANGTSVYLPTEYLRNKILSPAVDVYSYGIVILEMATGRRAYDGKRLLINSVEDEYSRQVSNHKSEVVRAPLEAFSYKYSEANFDVLMDRRIVGVQADRHWFNCLLELGRKCAHKAKLRRPTMLQVLEYFNQCKTTDRIHKLCDTNRSSTQSSSQQDRTNVTTPLELQLWYDFVRKSCGTLSDVVFENFGAQVTRMVEDYTGSNASSVSYHLERLLNSQQTDLSRRSDVSKQVPIPQNIPQNLPQNLQNYQQNLQQNLQNQNIYHGQQQLCPTIHISPATPTTLSSISTASSSSSASTIDQSAVPNSQSPEPQPLQQTPPQEECVQDLEESFIPLLTALGFKQE